MIELILIFFGIMGALWICILIEKKAKKILGKKLKPTNENAILVEGKQYVYDFDGEDWEENK